MAIGECPMKYELFYSTGGHVGPFKNFSRAVQAAVNRMSSPDERYMDIVPRGRGTTTRLRPYTATYRAIRNLELVKMPTTTYIGFNDR